MFFRVQILIVNSKSWCHVYFLPVSRGERNSGWLFYNPVATASILKGKYPNRLILFVYGWAYGLRVNSLYYPMWWPLTFPFKVALSGVSGSSRIWAEGNQLPDTSFSTLLVQRSSLSILFTCWAVGVDCSYPIEMRPLLWEILISKLAAVSIHRYNTIPGNRKEE